MNNRTSNPIEDELDVVRLKIYERIKDMTPEEEVAYFRAQNEPIIAPKIGRASCRERV